MASQTPTKPAHLEPSPLGTKEYWDSLYTTELSNHAVNPSDLGTIWFDDSSAEEKVLEFLHSPALALDVEKSSFLDVGTGNGHFLFRLREGGEEEDDDEDEDEDEDEDDDEGTEREGISQQNQTEKGGFKGRILGTDYSQKSVEFARRIARSKGLGEDSDKGRAVEFRYWDIMNDSPAGAVLEGPNADGWDVVLDKGTFDAISLSEEKDGLGRRICEGYRERVEPLVRKGGVLVVTSCNWTEEELRAWFESPDGAGDGEGLRFEGSVAYRSFSFGGKKGQTISSVCFRKGTVS